MNWWDLDLTALFNGPQAATGALGSFYDAAYGAQVWYISSSDRHVHQMYFNGGLTWADQDVTKAANGPQAATGTALFGFSDVFGEQALYVAIDGTDAHLHQLSASGFDQDLTGTATPVAPETAVPTAAVGGGLTNFEDTGHVVHSFYVGSDGEMHQFSSSNDATWTDENMTTAASGQKVASGSALASFTDTYGYHIFYISADQNVCQLYFDNAEWVDQNISAKAKGPQAAAKSGLSGFADTYGEHAFYVGSDQHVHHLNYAEGAWGIDQKGFPTTALQAAAGSALSSFGDTYGDHAIYIDTDQHVHQLYFDNNSWVDQDLTSRAKPVPTETSVPAAATGSALSSVSATVAGTLYELIFYVSANQHVHALCYAANPPGVKLPPTGSGPAATCPLGSVDTGAQYSSSIGASGGAGGPYSYAANGLPGWASLNPATGAITGTPTAAGTSTFTVTVTDATGVASSAVPCSIVVEQTSPPTAVCPAAVVGVGAAYNSSIGASGGAGGPYSYAANGLPGWASLNPSTGAITGTPTTAETSTFTVTVTDAKGETGTTVCAIIVGSQLTVGCPPAGTGTVGQAYSSSVGMSGGTAPYTYAVASGSLPLGLNLNTSTGAITGAPTTPGTSNFTVSVTDATGAKATSSVCGIDIGFTFQIQAIQYITSDPNSSGPDGPMSGLSFAVSLSGLPGASVASVMNSPGIYTLSGVASGTEVTLSEYCLHQGMQFLTSSGGVDAPQFFTVAFPQPVPTPVIFIGWAYPT